MIAVCKFGNGYSRLLMKHMVDASDSQTIFVYDITNRNMTNLEKSNNKKGKDKAHKNKGKDKSKPTPTLGKIGLHRFKT